ELRDSFLSNIVSKNNVNYGMYLNYLYNSRIDDATLDSNYDGIYAISVSDSNFSNISCQNETRYGAYFSNSQRNTFQALNIDYCGNYGFYSVSSNNYRFSFCNFNHSSYGFYTSTTSINNEFIRCNFNYNAQHGFYGNAISSTNFTWNNFIFNSNYGIYLSNANYNTFLYNNFSSNRYGVYLTTGNNNSFLGCRFYFNTVYGAYVTGSSSLNVFHHNNFIDNTNQAYDAQTYGNRPATAYAGNFVMGTNVAGNYLNNANCSAISPTIDCSGVFNVHLQFYRWLVLEISYDYAYVEVSNNNGLSYTQVGPTLNLQDSSWTFIDLDISTIADNQPNVKIRFRLTSDFSVVYTGWNIDELFVISGANVIFYDGFETITGWTFDGINNNWDIGTPINLSDIWDNQTNTGNYWSNWLGPDADGNGIVDIPYSLLGSAGRKDYYPVTTPFILENFPPILSSPSVTPIGGNISTLFTFSVNYSDINENIPTVARVYIDGVAYSLNYISGNHKTGALYQYSTTLSEDCLF
ncbi:MAG: right-handed parallel beta-helix repeat-containing protein, partial [Thermoplasmata archaeon]